MSIILVLVVVVVFAASIVPRYFGTAQEQFQQSASVNSPYGFTLSMRINDTHVSPGGSLKVTAWVNSTSPQIEQINSSDSWPVNQNLLWSRICTSGWPLGIGVMQGYFTEDDYAQGILLRLPQPLTSCPTSEVAPSFFLLETHGSKALVSLNGTVETWDLQTTLVLGPTSLGEGSPLSGTYTIVVADEWGDVVVGHFTI